MSVRELERGDQIGGYRIDEVISRGGMGVVYRATHVAMRRIYAVKVLASHLSEDVLFQERFKREMRLAASLRHPNVVEIHYAGEEDGQWFLVMDYIQGTDLRQVLERTGALHPERAVDLLAEFAAALDAAHTKGLVHRDVKPANMLITVKDGEEHGYLTDFGLAKRSDNMSALTTPGIVVGTVDYMAPEQITGEPTDARTDIYALGCAFYEMLTGNVPYDRENSIATLFAHVNDPPPALPEGITELHPMFRAVIEKAMAKKPDDRYLSAGDFARDAAAALSGIRYTQPPTIVATGAASPTISHTPTSDVGAGRPPTAPSTPVERAAGAPLERESPPASAVTRSESPPTAGRPSVATSVPNASEPEPPAHAVTEHTSRLGSLPAQPEAPGSPPAVHLSTPSASVTEPDRSAHPRSAPVTEPERSAPPPSAPGTEPERSAPPPSAPGTEPERTAGARGAPVTKPELPVGSPTVHVSAASAAPSVSDARAERAGSAPGDGPSQPPGHGPRVGRGPIRDRRWRAVALGAAVAAAIAAVIVVVTSGSSPSNASDHFAAAVRPVPTNRVKGTGNATIALRGDVATVTVNTNGLLNAVHLMHIHGGTGNCPPASAAVLFHRNRFISASVGDSFYGGVVTSLTVTGDTRPSSFLDAPRFPDTGNIRYKRTITLEPGVAAEIRRGLAVIVIHGINYDGNSTYDDVLGKGGEAGAPALCGAVFPAQNASVAPNAGGTVYTASLALYPGSDPAGSGPPPLLCHVGSTPVALPPTVGELRDSASA